MDGTAVAADWLVLLPVTKAVELEDGRLEVEASPPTSPWIWKRRL